MDARLQQLKDSLAGKTCMTLSCSDDRFAIKPLAQLEEVGYAVGQMACLIAARFMQKMAESGTGDGQWRTPRGVIPPDITLNQLYAEVALPDSQVVQAAADTAWAGNWPAGSDKLSGFASTQRTMTDLGLFLFFTAGNPVCNLKCAAGGSLGTRVSESYLWFRRAGHHALHAQHVFDALHHAMGNARLIAANEVWPL